MALIARLAESKGGCNKSAPSLVETKFGENRTGDGCGRNIINMKSMIDQVKDNETSDQQDNGGNDASGIDQMPILAIRERRIS